MLTKVGLPLVAIALIGFALNFLSTAQQRLPELPPPILPAQNPYANTVAGAGMIEPESENISIGSPVAGIVVEVSVRVGKSVSAGDPLFRLDDRELQAELRIRQSMLAAAAAELARLQAMPRKEEIPQAEARIREAQAEWENWEQQSQRAEKAITMSRGAMSEEEYIQRRQSAIQARERYNRAVADKDLLLAGAWEPDINLARAAVENAQAQVSETQTLLERLVVRAPVAGEVLQINVRPGEFVGAPAGQALVVLGNISQLHVRVDIDEYDIPRFVTDAPAEAALKGQPDIKFPLRFVRVEPYVVPKKSLTGDNTERVDTRVLQVIYAIDTGGRQLFVGQQLDVFINAGAAGEGKVAGPAGR
jgi:multidrug resistance efflux pump